MEVQITSELVTAHNKIVLAQQKITLLTQRGKGRDPEMKYWNEQLDAWTGYMNQLNQLQQYGHIEITKTVMSSGKFHITATSNGRYLKYISKGNIPPEYLASLSAGADYSLNNPPCKRCGAIGTELHHWAPKELFEDAEQWPQDYLCPNCHYRWHKTVTIPFRALRLRENLKVVKPAA
jgi:hypothetical protein